MCPVLERLERSRFTWLSRSSLLLIKNTGLGQKLQGAVRCSISIPIFACALEPYIYGLWNDTVPSLVQFGQIVGPAYHPELDDVSTDVYGELALTIQMYAEIGLICSRGDAEVGTNHFRPSTEYRMTTFRASHDTTMERIGLARLRRIFRVVFSYGVLSWAFLARYLVRGDDRQSLARVDCPIKDVKVHHSG